MKYLLHWVCLFFLPDTYLHCCIDELYEYFILFPKFKTYFNGFIVIIRKLAVDRGNAQTLNYFDDTCYCEWTCFVTFR